MPPTRARSGRLGRATLRGVLVFTLPLVALGLFLFGSAVFDYYRISQFDDWNSRGKHVDRYGFLRLRAALRAPKAWSIEHRLSAEKPDVEALRIVVDRSEFDRIADDAAGTWGEEIDADLVSGDGLHPVSLRLRGDTSIHWTSAKKSLTVKAGRGELFKGYRTLAFSGKDVLSSWLVNSMPERFDVLCSTTNVVPIYLNERFYGLFRFIEPLDESYLRGHVLLPGNIFRGDAAERGEYFKGVERELFKNVAIWDRAAKNDRPGSIGTAAIGWFLDDLNGTTFEQFERFEAWFDRAELARLLALCLAVGDPFHMSGVHNQFWYEDPSSGLLHPIAWDLRLLDLAKPPQNSRFNRFWRTLLRDPRVLDEAFDELAKQLEGDALLRDSTERMNGVAERFADEIAYEQLRAGQIPEVNDPEECLATLKKNLEHLRGHLDLARVAWHGSAPVDGIATLDIEVRGFSRVDFKGLRWGPLDVERIVADTDLDGVLSDRDREIPFSFRDVVDPFLVFDQSEPLLPGANATGDRLQIEPIHYRFFVLGDGARAPSEPWVENPRSDRPVELVAWTADAAIGATTSWHPWRFQAKPRSTIALEGDLHLAQTLVVPEEATLRIAPGTHLRLDPDVSILVKGKLVAPGTAERPITIENAVEKRPWGTLALQGAGANGSKLEHVTFKGGGGGLLERVEYTAMVCVHNCVDVRFERCRFLANMRCDDMAHADRADLYLIECEFQDANGDALDYDMSGGEVRGCSVSRTVNDGLDFMTCWPKVIGNRMFDCGDKGISIGENSSPLVFDNVITNCNRGMEVKDNSRPVVVHNRIEGNKTGIRERLKNWRYGGGGWASVINTVVSGNGQALQLEPRTRLSLHGAQIDGLGGGDVVEAPRDARFALLPFGIDASNDRLGELGQWRDVEPLEPIAKQRFREDFELPTDGWKADARLRLLEKRDFSLVATMRRQTKGAFWRELEWKIADAGVEHQLVLEVATEHVAEATVRVIGDGVERSATLDVRGDPGLFQYLVLDLPPGAYRELRFDAAPANAPQGESSRIHLHGFQLFAFPRDRGAR